MVGSFAQQTIFQNEKQNKPNKYGKPNWKNAKYPNWHSPNYKLPSYVKHIADIRCFSEHRNQNVSKKPYDNSNGKQSQYSFHYQRQQADTYFWQRDNYGRKWSCNNNSFRKEINSPPYNDRAGRMWPALFCCIDVILYICRISYE